MKKTIIILLSLFLAGSLVQAQNYTVVKTINLKAKAIEVDHFGNIYVVEEYKISKYNTLGELLFTYSDTNLGEIESLDAANPLKLLVFYKDQQSLRILDSKLSELYIQFLSDMGFDNVEAICTNNNSYWIFDNDDFKIKKLNKRFEIIFESDSYFQVFPNEKPPKELRVNQQELYCLNSEGKGVKIFDSYANYIKSINIVAQEFQIINNQMVFFDNSKLLKYDNKTLNFSKFDVPTLEKVITVKLMKDKLVYLTEKKVVIYSID